METRTCQYCGCDLLTGTFHQQVGDRWACSDREACNGRLHDQCKIDAKRIERSKRQDPTDDK
jgi:hypothetical protein